MQRITVRLPEDLLGSLERRAHGAELSLSSFVRSVLVQAADPRSRYIYSSQDEVLAICLQILAILMTSVGDRAPDTLARGIKEAKRLLGERGLFDPERDG